MRILKIEKEMKAKSVHWISWKRKQREKREPSCDELPWYGQKKTLGLKKRSKVGRTPRHRKTKQNKKLGESDSPERKPRKVSVIEERKKSSLVPRAPERSREGTGTRPE